jgi:F-type H+-transporting ATPase subunit gamma
MAKTRNILKHVRAVGNIRTVTKAMQTVASARFKQAHDRISSFGPYAAHVTEIITDVAAKSTRRQLDHPLLRPASGLARDVLLVVTSNRGLCGSYNQAVLNVAIHRLLQLRRGDYEVELHVIGARGVRYLRFRGIEPDEVHEDFGDLATYEQAAALADSMMQRYLDGQISGLEVVYTQFVSSGQQPPAVAQVLPVADLPSSAAESDEDEKVGPAPLPYDFLPSPKALLARLLPTTVRLKLYQCLLDAAAAEQFMRRVAMQAATDNADDMIHELKIHLNRTRQMQITTELSEIMGGRAGLGE